MANIRRIWNTLQYKVVYFFCFILVLILTCKASLHNVFTFISIITLQIKLWVVNNLWITLWITLYKNIAQNTTFVQSCFFSFLPVDNS